MSNEDRIYFLKQIAAANEQGNYWSPGSFNAIVHGKLETLFIEKMVNIMWFAATPKFWILPKGYEALREAEAAASA